MINDCLQILRIPGAEEFSSQWNFRQVSSVKGPANLSLIPIDGLQLKSKYDLNMQVLLRDYVSKTPSSILIIQNAPKTFLLGPTHSRVSDTKVARF